MDDHAHNVQDIKVMVAGNLAVAPLPCSTNFYPLALRAGHYSGSRAIRSMQAQRSLKKEELAAVGPTTSPTVVVRQERSPGLMFAYVVLLW